MSLPGFVFKRKNKSFKQDICRFDCQSNFLVSISILINNWNGNVSFGVRTCLVNSE